jgi:hypothetical protein
MARRQINKEPTICLVQGWSRILLTATLPVHDRVFNKLAISLLWQARPLTRNISATLLRTSFKCSHFIVVLFKEGLFMDDYSPIMSISSLCLFTELSKYYIHWCISAYRSCCSFTYTYHISAIIKLCYIARDNQTATRNLSDVQIVADWWVYTNLYLFTVPGHLPPARQCTDASLPILLQPYMPLTDFPTITMP